MGIQLKTFRMGGIHPKAEKITAGKGIVSLPIPGEVDSIKPTYRCAGESVSGEGG